MRKTQRGNNGWPGRWASVSGKGYRVRESERGERDGGEGEREKVREGERENKSKSEREK